MNLFRRLTVALAWYLWAFFAEASAFLWSRFDHEFVETYVIPDLDQKRLNLNDEFPSDLSEPYIDDQDDIPF